VTFLYFHNWVTQYRVGRQVKHNNSPASAALSEGTAGSPDMPSSPQPQSAVPSARLFPWLIVTLALLLSGCKSTVSVRMEPAGTDFFDMPWPNDARRHSDGSLSFAGYAPLGINPALTLLMNRGARSTPGFGLHSGMMFRFSGAIDPALLPSPTDTLRDDSPVQVVNIDPTSPAYLQRTPVRLRFNTLATLYMPAHLLTVLPVGGHGLAPGARHAVLLFDGLRDTRGKPVARNTLLNELAGGGGTALQRSQHAAISSYLRQNSRWQEQQLVGYTVFTTQTPTVKARALGEALEAISDEQVRSNVHSLRTEVGCPQYGFALLRGELSVPRWQTGSSPYLLGGGDIPLGADGRISPTAWERTPFTVAIGCATPGMNGRKIIVRADGTGADSTSAVDIPVQFLDSQGFSGIALSIAPFHSSERRSVSIDQFADFIRKLGLNFQESDMEGFAYYNYTNPVAAIGNQLQGASDHSYLRRVGTQLPVLLARFGIDEQALGIATGSFRVDTTTAGIVGQSQGAGSAPLAVSIDEGFRFAYLNGAASHAYPQALHRGTVRTLINQLMLGIMANELDDFHPLMQFLQTFHEPADATNYVDAPHLRDLLITAGYHDGCVVRESAGALGLAYARAGKLQLGATGTGLPEFSGIQSILGQSPVELPLYDDNLASGGTGLFLEIVAGHDGAGASQTIKAFMGRVAEGRTQAIPAPYIPSGYWGCDTRID
jgi:hypothetical protein